MKFFHWIPFSDLVLTAASHLYKWCLSAYLLVVSSRVVTSLYMPVFAS